jgi:hypothetical protein
MGLRAFLEAITSRLVILPAALAALIAGLWLVPAQKPAPKLAPIEMVSPAQMQQAMERLNEDHEAVADLVQRQQAAEDEKEAARARALDAARDEAVNEERAKAAAAAAVTAAREAALKAAAQRKLAEAPGKPVAHPAPKIVQVPVEISAADPLPIAPPPPAVAPRRGPFDRAIAKANELTDKTLAAADAVRGFFMSAAEKLIGGATGSSPSSHLTSSY